MNTEVTEELQEIQEQMIELLDRAEWLLRHAGNPHALASAQAYWLAHIRCAITRDHDYLGGSMVTLEDTIHALDKSATESSE